MATTYEVIQAIHQAAADAADHPYGGKDTGVLKREKGHFITDSRVWDGFKVKIGGNVLTLTYQTECKMKEAHDKNFESDLEKTLSELSSYLKKEYKKSLGEALKLKELGEMKAVITETSRVRCWVQATMNYEIGNLDAPDDSGKERKKVYDKIDTMLKEGYQPELVWKKWMDSNED